MKVFANRRERNTFVWLFLGSILILVAFSFVTHLAMQQLAWEHFEEQQISHIMNTYKVASKAKNFKRSDARITTQPTRRIKKIAKPTPKNIRPWLKLHRQGGQLALRLPQQRWLILNVRQSIHLLWWRFAGFGFVALLLLLGLAILFAWAIRRSTFPFNMIGRAAKRMSENRDNMMLARTGIAELDEIVNALNQMQARIGKLLTDRTQMLAAVSHDLRTPITRLKLRAESVTDSALHDKILLDLDEMENMINALLAFVREDMQHEALERFDLNALLDSICNDMIDAGFEVSCESMDEPLVFEGYILSLKRALVNLIDNALKYGKKAHVQLSIKNQQIYIEIEDEGPGLAAEQLDKVFEPFYRVERSRSRQTGGSGLGLAICREIIEAHRGSVRLINRSEGGLKAIVVFPVS